MVETGISNANFMISYTSENNRKSTISFVFTYAFSKLFFKITKYSLKFFLFLVCLQIITGISYARIPLQRSSAGEISFRNSPSDSGSHFSDPWE
jgi:hypothetical protein